MAPDRSLYSDSTIGAPVSIAGMTFYELLRSLIRAAKWSRDNELDALDLIDRLEAVGIFGSTADTLKTREIT